jgi:Flp pilus assembly protein TadG
MTAVAPLRRGRLCRTGQAMVEFAIAALALLVVLFGIMQMGEAVYCYTAVSDAAREAARYAIVHSPTSPNPATTAQIQQAAINAAPGLDSTKLTVNVSWPADPNISSQSDAQIAVSYVFSLQIPLWGTTNVTLTSTSRMLTSQ